MVQIGKIIVLFGLGVVAIGGLVWLTGTFFPGFKPGRLPGDIVIEGERGGIYIPVVTMILVSVVATVMMWIFSAVRK